ncbi:MULTISPECIES: hypothetical protein [Acidithiobacillus]|uniref:hypothetical protein n=1 Tax=Acidithiobacillus ferrivorans TaxID=160808 RepID=UPI001C06BAB0|nr:hypothetical protein [Acidithiobacillus ferrivorans]MBU2851599.1 hypothetical protein [Acidithiobacillus ferrivorans]
MQAISRLISNINVHWLPLTASLVLAFISVFLSLTLTNIYVTNNNNRLEVSEQLFLRIFLGVDNRPIIELLLFWLIACFSVVGTILVVAYAIIAGGITSTGNFANNSAGNFIKAWLDITTSVSTEISVIAWLFFLMLFTLGLFKLVSIKIFLTINLRRSVLYIIGYIAIVYEKVVLIFSTVAWTFDTVFLIYRVKGVPIEWVLIIGLPMLFFCCFLAVAFNIGIDEARKNIAVDDNSKKFTGISLVNKILQRFTRFIINDLFKV